MLWAAAAGRAWLAAATVTVRVSNESSAPPAVVRGSASSVTGLAEAASACDAWGVATSAPAMAKAGAALPACCATFSTCEGVA